ncbi:unnamed protein product [Amoebophrya sp. A120]|nr:unnamed protein product [Amoebophrya sp. A120]|eukprot:GSA120T00026327001.1
MPFFRRGLRIRRRAETTCYDFDHHRVMSKMRRDGLSFLSKCQLALCSEPLSCDTV